MEMSSYNDLINPMAEEKKITREENNSKEWFFQITTLTRKKESLKSNIKSKFKCPGAGEKHLYLTLLGMSFFKVAILLK